MEFSAMCGRQSSPCIFDISMKIFPVQSESQTENFVMSILFKERIAQKEIFDKSVRKGQSYRVQHLNSLWNVRKHKLTQSPISLPIARHSPYNRQIPRLNGPIRRCYVLKWDLSRNPMTIQIIVQLPTRCDEESETAQNRNTQTAVWLVFLPFCCCVTLSWHWHQHTSICTECAA